MTEQSLRSDLAKFLAVAPAELRLRNYLVRGASIEDSDLFRFEFDPEFTAGVILDVRNVASRLGDGELIRYDPAYQIAGHQALFDDLDALPQVAAIIGEAVGDDVPADDGEGRPIVAMTHLVETDEVRVTAMRLRGAGVATRRRSGLTALLPRNGIYSQIRQEILYYEPRFDVLVVGGQVAVTATTTIQSRLGSPDRARKLARQTFASVTSRLKIEGLEQLRDAAETQPNMVAKMASIARTIANDPGYLDLLTMPNLAKFLRDNPHVEVQLTGAPGQETLVFDPRPQTRYAILKLIADDNLRSALTGRNYEAGSKQIQAPTT